MKILQITNEQARQIIKTRKPIGLFYTKEKDIFVGIDNSSEDAWTEEFLHLEDCLQWLQRNEV